MTAMIQGMPSPFDVGQRVAYRPTGEPRWRAGRVGNYPPVLGVAVYDDEHGRMDVVSSDRVRALTDSEAEDLETYGELRTPLPT